MRTTIAVLVALVLTAAAGAAELHVAVTGDDAHPATHAAPLRTIQRAADMAQPGDVITVHAGIYRERIDPPRGGESDDRRIVYQAAPGETVEIRGSEPVKDWVKVADDVWKVTIPNSFFGEFNPYADLIRGDWFNPKGREHHTGAVYLDGHWLTEAAALDDLMKGLGETALWFAQVDRDNTTIFAQFKGIDPNERDVEINVRQTVFYPSRPGINYITVRGFVMRHAATPWAPPTAEQRALIGTHWSRGWIIENNVISHSVCSGIALGKYGDEWDNRSESAEGYNRTIRNALANGWSKEKIGAHLVRGNEISHCEQAGIVGSLGPVFSTITDNTIHDIHVRRLFGGAEMAGIKFHGAIDVEITRNHIYRTCLGLWLDWMAQGTRVSANLFHDNGRDLFVEVNHGPFVVDNNIFLSPASLLSYSRGGAYAHNLFAGAFNINPYDARQTPFHKAHSTEVAGLHDNPCGDDRYYNNLLVHPADLSVYDDKARLPVFMNGNVFLNGAKPSAREENPLRQPETDPAIRLIEKPDGLYLEITFDPTWASGGATRDVVTTQLLGRASVPDLPYEQRDGSPIRISADYFGKERKAANPTPGPFDLAETGRVAIKVRQPR